MFAIIIREIGSTAGRSSLGYLWAILEPIGAIVVLSVAFSIVFHNPALGQNFPFFYATGFLPFSIYSSLQQKSSTAISQNAPLLFYPEVTYMDAIFGRFILVFFTQVLTAIIIFSGIILIFGLTPSIDFVDVMLSLVLASVLGLTIGILNAVLIYILPSWRHLWGIITRPLFLASCVFYIFDHLPDWVKEILWFNPLVHVVGLMRKGFYSSYHGTYISISYVLGLSGLIMLVALLLLRSYAKDMINN